MCLHIVEQGLAALGSVSVQKSGWRGPENGHLRHLFKAGLMLKGWVRARVCAHAHVLAGAYFCVGAGGGGPAVSCGALHCVFGSLLWVALRVFGCTVLYIAPRD